MPQNHVAGEEPQRRRGRTSPTTLAPVPESGPGLRRECAWQPPPPPRRIHGVSGPLFEDRGISLDTNLWPDYLLDAAFRSMEQRGLLKVGGVRRVAIVGPGLDFANKEAGNDFYPPQTIQYYGPFEQSLARANISAMLRPGGFLVSNDRLPDEVPSELKDVLEVPVVSSEQPLVQDFAFCYLRTK